MADRPLILLYHSVQTVPRDPWGIRVSPRHFAEHMAIVRQLANPISLRQLDDAIVQGDVPKRAVAITFDDGYADNLHHALPALARARVPATIFVATGYVDALREYWWDELDRLLLKSGQLPDEIVLRLPNQESRWSFKGQAKLGWLAARRLRNWRAWEPHRHVRQRVFTEAWGLLRRENPAERDEALEQLCVSLGESRASRPTHRSLNSEQLRRLAAHELIEIGAHTINHPSLGFVSSDVQQVEIIQSKAWLESILQRQITSFSYPFGTRDDYSQHTIELLRQAGFERSCSNFSEPIDVHVDRFQYPRRVVMDWNGREFASKLAKWFAE